MRNGIKKLFLTSLFVIFGMCFNSSFAYTEIENCYDTNKLCRDYSVNESYNTNGATISYGAYLNTPGYSKTFMVQYDYTNSSSITFKIRQYLFYNEDGYYSIIQAFQRETEPLKTTIYVYTGSTGYCIPEEDNNRCGSATNSFKPYNKSIELVNSGINGSIMTGYRIMFYDSTPNLVHVICPMFENGFMFCMPFRQQTNNGVISNSTNYGLPTRTNPYSDYTPPFEDRNYISSNYTIGNTPFTTTEPQTTPTPVTWSCPTIQDLINAYPTNYNTGLCYSSSLIVSGGTLQTVTPSSIFELFPSIQEFGNYINLYNNYCTSANTTTACQTAFDGNQEKYTLIAKLPNETNRIGIYQYCHYQLNIENKNTSTCVMSTGEMYATGVNEQIAEEIENQNTSLIGLIEDSIQNIKEIPTFNTGYVFDELLDDGETRTDGIKLDVFKTFLLLWSKITTIFYFRNSQPGIIPQFITTIIIIIVLFKLFKK